MFSESSISDRSTIFAKQIVQTTVLNHVVTPVLLYASAHIPFPSLPPPVFAVGSHLCPCHEHGAAEIIAGAGHTVVAGGAGARLCGAGAASRRVQAARRTVRLFCFLQSQDTIFNCFFCIFACVVSLA